MIGADGAHFETKILVRRIFQGECLRQRGIGAGALARRDSKIALELLFSKLAYIGSDCEAEQMLVSIPSARATIEPKATMAATISNIGFMISVLKFITTWPAGRHRPRAAAPA
jgi:hypothetical protein